MKTGIREEIMEAMSTETLFTIPLFGGIPIKESIAVMWIITGVLIVVFWLLGRNLSVDNPNRKQMVIELFHEKMYGFMYGLVGEHGKQYISYLLFILIFIGTMDLFPVIGFKPPTKDVNVTLAMAVISIVLVQYASIRAKGVKGWLKSFKEPVAIVTPMNILEIIIKPFSLCMRLFGNMLGAFLIMKMIEYVVPMVLPAIAGLYFDWFDGLLQAFVFTFLTALYIQEAVEVEEG